MGGIMAQDGDVIFCFLKKFNEKEMKHPTIEQEHLAIAEIL